MTMVLALVSLRSLELPADPLGLSAWRNSLQRVLYED